VVLRGLQDLAKFLQSQVHILEDESAEEKRRKLVYDRVPGEVVRDPAGLARELMWRASRELHEEAHELGAGKVELNGARGGKLQWKEKTVDMKMLPAVSKVTGFKPT
jgi:F-box/leucine-rich repeat protein 10/11